MRNIFKNKFHGIICKIKNNPKEAKEKFKNLNDIFLNILGIYSIS